jgi:CheY-like chemotaxis protein
MKDQLNILLVEDDPNDVYFLLYAFDQAGLRNPVKVVEDGQQAIEYLSGTGKYADREQFPLPYLVLLDLKLPKVMGLDVLRWMGTRPELSGALVIVLSSSNDAGDIANAYTCGARSYLVKPHSLSDRLELAKCIKAYWIEMNSPPPISPLPHPLEPVTRPADLSNDGHQKKSEPTATRPKLKSSEKTAKPT